MDALLVASLVSGASAVSATASALAVWGLTRGPTRRLREQVATLESEAAVLAPLREIRDGLDHVTHLRAESEREILQLRSTAHDDIQREAEAAQKHASEHLAAAQATATRLLAEARAEVARVLAEASQAAGRLKRHATDEADRSREEATRSREAAKERVRVANEEAQRVVGDAQTRARAIVAAAEQKAQETAGAAIEAMRDADRWAQTVKAMKNLAEGYGDRYVVATHSFLDGLANDFGFAEAGQELRRARELSRVLVKEGRAGTCDYVEASRRDTAVRFVVDAFNGKVDSILTQVKVDNVGTLAQQIRDAFSLVNHNGAAFRAARVTQEYLEARLDELKWAVAAVELKERAREEQRQIKEQLREEEKARRERERALREAQKEEETLRKAIEKAQSQVAKANDEQRAKYELQLAELTARLTEAESRNQRAVSMAQLTRSGHVYVISNVGSFGEEVYKVGMTRRLEPLDRIRELGDASVPFGFDVHALIWSEDAPGLERDLHRALVTVQVNKVNPRKEFFRTPIAAIRALVDQRKLEAVWTMSAAAVEYRETYALEQSMAADPVVREAWLRRQYAWDPAEEMEQEELGEA